MEVYVLQNRESEYYRLVPGWGWHPTNDVEQAAEFPTFDSALETAKRINHSEMPYNTYRVIGTV